MTPFHFDLDKTRSVMLQRLERYRDLRDAQRRQPTDRRAARLEKLEAKIMAAGDAIEHRERFAHEEATRYFAEHRLSIE